MSDANFRVEKILRHAAAHSERTAVIKSLLPRTNAALDDQVEAAVLRILEFWRRRCNDLRKEGWRPAAKTVRFQYMRNCPPSCVSMRPQNRRDFTYPCKVAVCPWCWSRMVVKRTWEVIHSTMSALGDMYARGHSGPYPHKLVFTSTSCLISDDSSQPMAALDQVSNGMVRSKRMLQKDTLGQVILGFVAPTSNGWRVGQRALALVPWDFPIDKPRLKVCSIPTKRRVANFVARLTRYPTGFMYGNCRLLSRLLDVRRCHRLLRFSGVFYKNSGLGMSASEEEDDTRYLDL